MVNRPKGTQGRAFNQRMYRKSLTLVKQKNAILSYVRKTKNEIQFMNKNLTFHPKINDSTQYKRQYQQLVRNYKLKKAEERQAQARLVHQQKNRLSFFINKSMTQRQLIKQPKKHSVRQTAKSINQQSSQQRSNLAVKASCNGYINKLRPKQFELQKQV